jgi:hypothetical protein
MENSYVYQQNWVIDTIYAYVQDLPISWGSVSIMIVFIFIFNTRIRISVGMATTCKISKWVIYTWPLQLNISKYRNMLSYKMGLAINLL